MEELHFGWKSYTLTIMEDHGSGWRNTAGQPDGPVLRKTRVGWHQRMPDVSCTRSQARSTWSAAGPRSPVELRSLLAYLSPLKPIDGWSVLIWFVEFLELFREESMVRMVKSESVSSRRTWQSFGTSVFPRR